MNVLDFYADTIKYEDEAWYKEERVFRLPTQWDKLFYCRVRTGGRRHKYIYEYYLLKAKEGKIMNSFFLALAGSLDGFTVKEQYGILERLKTIELDYNPIEEEMGRDSIKPYPVFSVRGTCGQEQDCKKKCACRTIYFEPCCSRRKVGFSNVADIKNPRHYAILTSLVIWKALCPNLDAVFIMHDSSLDDCIRGKLDYSYAFRIKDNKITYIADKEKVERLYRDYNEKYPCDTSEIEKKIHSKSDKPVNFHF